MCMISLFVEFVFKAMKNTVWKSMLKVFMNAQNTENDKIMWYIILHMTFVISAFAMGYLDQISKKKA